MEAVATDRREVSFGAACALECRDRSDWVELYGDLSIAEAVAAELEYWAIKDGQMVEIMEDPTDYIQGIADLWEGGPPTATR